MTNELLAAKTAAINEDLAYHQARVVLLISSVMTKKGAGKKLDGLTKLAKLDFLVRYPILAQRVVPALSSDGRLRPSEDDARESEAPMIRYKYGPWDDRYYPVIGALVGRGLATYQKGRAGSIALRLTAAGQRLAAELRASDSWRDIAQRCDAVADQVGDWTGNRLKEAIYERLPEVLDRPHREVIRR